MQQLKVKNLGQVKHIEIPTGWVAKLDRDDSQPYLKEYSPQDRADVKLIFYYRGSRVDRQSGIDFHNILKLAPHDLPPAEKLSLVFVLRDIGATDLFETLSMRTDNINRKTVLLTEGLWRKSNLHNLAIFVDTDGTGTAVQEIHYTAPPAVYLKYLPTIKDAIKSIKWK